jgi:hypothetical protein
MRASCPAHLILLDCKRLGTKKYNV